MHAADVKNVLRVFSIEVPAREKDDLKEEPIIIKLRKVSLLMHTHTRVSIGDGRRHWFAGGRRQLRRRLMHGGRVAYHLQLVAAVCYPCMTIILGLARKRAVVGLTHV